MKRTFEVYTHPLRDGRAIKRGFSWPGFFFPPIWALTKRLWLTGTILLIISAVLTMLSRGLIPSSPLFVILLMLGYRLVVGLKGNSWLRKAIEDRGYSYCCSIRANSSADALAKLARAGGVIPDE